MQVILKCNRDPEDERIYWSLTVGRQYEVIGIECDSYRIVNDAGDPVLFSPSCFEIVDATEPEFWEESCVDEGERYAYPPDWGKPGFFEDYHDGVEEVRRRFWDDHRRYYGEPRPPTKSPEAWRTFSFDTMTDTELVKTLHDFDPLASNLSDLLIEMWKREIREAKSYGRKLMAGNLDGNLNRHPDAKLYGVLEVMCGCFNRPSEAQAWLDMAFGYEQRILDVLMIIAVRDNPKMGYEVLDLAKKEGDYHIISKALQSIILSVPTSDSSLQECLIPWAEDRGVMPNTRVDVFRRLSKLPWAQDLEDFFVRCHIEDDGSDATMTDAINEALKQRH